MAYPIILYDATSGSDTAPADAIATGSAASGTGAATTIELGGTFDLTDAADDDSDYIWCSTTAGQRHLFQITSFTGGAATCTAVVVAEAIGATTFSGANWHINGSRLTMVADTSRYDWADWGWGWVAQFDAGTYVTGASFNPGETLTPSTLTPAITVVAKTGAASRPVIDQTVNNYVALASGGAVLILEGIKMTCSGGGSLSGLLVNAGNITLDDVVLDLSGGSVANAITASGGTRSVSMVGCYVTGATQTGVSLVNSHGGNINNCVFDGQGGTYFSTCGVSLTAYQGNMALTNSIVMGCAGDGVQIQGNESQALIDNVTSVDNGGDGFSIQDTASANATPNSNGYVVNCIAAFNGAYGFSTPSIANRYIGQVLFKNNATYSNTSGAYGGQITASVDGVACSVDPFTNSGTGDYTLNNTAGGGADLRGAAYPATLPDGT